MVPSSNMTGTEHRPTSPRSLVSSDAVNHVLRILSVCVRTPLSVHCSPAFRRSTPPYLCKVDRDPSVSAAGDPRTQFSRNVYTMSSLARITGPDAAATMRGIHTAAQALFRQFGYRATSLEDVAKAVGLPKRTVRDYFPAKELLLFCEFSELLLLLEAALDQRPHDEPPLNAALNCLLEVQGAQELYVAAFVEGCHIISSGSKARIIRQLEQPLAVLLTERLMRSDPPLPAQEAAFAGAVHARRAVSICQTW